MLAAQVILEASELIQHGRSYYIRRRQVSKGALQHVTPSSVFNETTDGIPLLLNPRPQCGSEFMGGGIPSIFCVQVEGQHVNQPD